MSKRVISLWMENQPGALSRVAGLLSARGYNVDSLTVAPTHDPSLSRMTMVTHGDDEIVEQIIKQLNKLIDILKVLDLTAETTVLHEMAFIKVRALGEERQEIKRISDIFRARIIDMTASTYVLEVTGTSTKLDALLAALADMPVIEVVRSGVVGIARGDRALGAR